MLDGETNPGAAPQRAIASSFREFPPLSPDGARLVYHARGPRGAQLYLRDLPGSTPRPLRGRKGPTTPFFSPDGRWVGFWRAEDRILKKVSVRVALRSTSAPRTQPHFRALGSGRRNPFEAGFPTGPASRVSFPHWAGSRRRSSSRTVPKERNSLRAEYREAETSCRQFSRRGDAWLRSSRERREGTSASPRGGTASWRGDTPPRATWCTGTQTLSLPFRWNAKSLGPLEHPSRSSSHRPFPVALQRRHIGHGHGRLSARRARARGRARLAAHPAEGWQYHARRPQTRPLESDSIALSPNGRDAAIALLEGAGKRKCGSWTSSAARRGC